MSTRQGAILHLIDTTGPGGAETIFTQLAAYSQELGYRSVAVIRGPGWVEQELARLGIDTRIIDCKGSFNTKFLGALKEIVRSEHIDLIQAHLLGSSLYASLAGLLTGTPVVSTFHGHVDVSPNERLRLAKFLLIQQGSSHIIAVTQQLRAMLAAVPTLSSSKVKTIPNGIDTTIFAPGPAAPFREEFNIPSEAILLGCLGNVRKAKNYNIAIKALALLNKQGIDARLLIAGDDKNKLAEEHRQYADELGIAAKILWLGFYTDTPAFLNAIDIFLLSSSSEGHPLALTQAMATGVPIVTTKCGVEEIVEHRKTALIVENGNAGQLAEHIVELSQNPQLRDQLVAAAQTLAKDTLSLTAMCERYQALYDGLLTPSGSEQPKRSWVIQHIINRYGSKKALLTTLRHSANDLLGQKYRKYRRVPSHVNRVVFVCKGNICRSAVAEYAFRQSSHLVTTSIGLDTHTGKEGNARIAGYAKNVGIDMTNHRTTSVKDFTAQEGDLFVCMEPDHALAVEKLFGADKTILLGCFGQPKRLYIHDPYSSADRYAETCTSYIIQTSKNLADQIERSS